MGVNGHLRGNKDGDVACCVPLYFIQKKKKETRWNQKTRPEIICELLRALKSRLHVVLLHKLQYILYVYYVDFWRKDITFSP